MPKEDNFFESQYAEFVKNELPGLEGLMKDLDQPTEIGPGTMAKVELMARRVASGLPLNAQGDVHLGYDYHIGNRLDDALDYCSEVAGKRMEEEKRKLANFKRKVKEQPPKKKAKVRISPKRYQEIVKKLRRRGLLS